MKNKDELKGPILLSRGYGNSYKWLWQIKGMKYGPKALVAYLCSYMGAGNTAFPSRAKICYDLEINKDTLGKWLKVLTEDTNILIVTQVRNDENGHFSHNIYTLNYNPEFFSPRLKKLNTQGLPSPEKSASAPCPKKPDTVKPAPVKPDTNNNSSNNNNVKKEQQQQPVLLLAAPAQPEPVVVVSSASQKEEKQKSIDTNVTKQTEPANQPVEELVTNEKQESILQLVEMGVSKNVAIELAQLKSAADIDLAVCYAKGKNTVQDKPAFIVTALRQDWTLVTTKTKEKSVQAVTEQQEPLERWTGENVFSNLLQKMRAGRMEPQLE